MIIQGDKIIKRSLILDAETASRIAIIDPDKKVKSADTATYPSLTELAFFKGVTSSVQTQLDNLNKNSFSFSVDNGNNLLVLGLQNGRTTATCDGTITGWRIVGNATGSVVIDVLKNGTSITGTNKPTITSDTDSSGDDTSWTTSFVAGDIFTFNIESVSTFSFINLQVTYNK